LFFQNTHSHTHTHIYIPHAFIHSFIVEKSEWAKEFLLNPQVSDDDNLDLEHSQEEEDEAQHLQKLSEIHLKCSSLDNAVGNPKAHAFFSRPPNEIEGFDRMWCAAIDDACFQNLAGSFRNYGVEFACNFGEWEDGCDADAFQSIEDIASYKARKVYEVTGLPTIASGTSFEVEPARVPDRSNPMNRMLQNSRVTSGYRFNSVGDHVDYIIEALKPYSEPTRVTRFRSCFCFYDGDLEIFDYGELDCDIHFANSVRTFIPMSCGIDGIGKTLQLAFGLEFQGWLRKKVRDAMNGNESRISMQLRDRILKEGKVLPNNIVDVSAFMDSMVDVNLMDDCAKELSKRFESLKPTKILTVATTGLVLAIPMAKYLQVPVVYARKERNIVMSDTYKANYSSKTVGKNRELMVSKKHIHPDDRILVVDDFLSSGASQEALLRIVSDSGASAVGVGILLEKVYDAGRQFLSGFNIPVESIAKIASVKDGIITMEEEEGYTSVSR
jgi:Adenine/guanine phosphoribosyltransferases and related PRPP-binding proteins